jgi:hypothetical protein
MSPLQWNVCRQKCWRQTGRKGCVFFWKLLLRRWLGVCAGWRLKLEQEAARARSSGSLDPPVCCTVRPPARAPTHSWVCISWNPKNCVSELNSCYITCLTSLIPGFYTSGQCPPSNGREDATFTVWERCKCRNRLTDSSFLCISADVALFVSCMNPGCVWCSVTWLPVMMAT